jgi:5-methylcytosine-specific restriction protein A
VTNRRDERRQADDRRREELKPWRAWYRTKRWYRKRAAYKKGQPFCVKCLARGMHRPWTSLDHVEPHRGDAFKFWHGEVQGLCEPCHVGAKQLEELEGFSRDIGDDGWPVDPRHPINRPR